MLGQSEVLLGHGRSSVGCSCSGNSSFKISKVYPTLTAKIATYLLEIKKLNRAILRANRRAEKYKRRAECLEEQLIKATYDSLE